MDGADGLSLARALDILEKFGLPGLVVIVVALLYRFPRAQQGERQAWVFRIEIAVAKDTLVQAFALWRRIVDGRRPPRPEPSEEDSADADTPEMQLRTRRR